MIDDALERATREPSTGGKRLVLVVHGLGDDRPGEKVQAVGRALEIAGGRSRSPIPEVLWLPQGSDRQVDECEFPCHVERVRSGGDETVLAEVYWADHSGVGRGILATVLGLFRLLFGVHQAFARHAPEAARRAGDPAAAALRWLAMGSAYLLRGPATALMVSWALFVLVVALWGLMYEVWEPVAGGSAAGELGGDPLRGLSLAANSIGLAVGIAGYRWRRGRTHSEPFLWLAIFSLPWLVVMLVRPSLVLGGVGNEQLEIGKAWVHSALGTAVLPWIVYLLILLAAVAWLIARLRAAAAHRPGLDIAQGASYLTLLLWGLLAQFFLLLGVRYLGAEATPPEAEMLLANVAGFMAVNGALALILLTSVLVTLVLKARWKQRTRASSYRPSRPVPRLVLGSGMTFTLIVLPLVLVPLLWPPLAASLREALGPASRLITLAVPLVAGVAVYASESLHMGVDFLLDFVSHFERRVSAADGKPAFVRRERIRERLRIVLRTLVERERPDKVTILAHSQGTVITIETLAEEGAGELLAPLDRCDLVSMGSPFHHIYQHYFPHDYPPLAHPRWDGLRRRVDRWVNIFRIDDYFGVDIEPGGSWPENLPVDAGGHGGYWSDRQVHRILDERQLV